MKKLLAALSILLTLSCAVSAVVYAQGFSGAMVPCAGGPMIPNCGSSSGPGRSDFLLANTGSYLLADTNSRFLIQ